MTIGVAEEATTGPALMEGVERMNVVVVRGAGAGCHIQVHLSRNNVPTVKPPPNHTSLPFTAATFLATRLMAVLQPSRYSVFHSGDTPIQLGLP